MAELKQFLKTFPCSRYYAEHRLLAWHPRGIFDEQMADVVIEVLEIEEILSSRPFNRYSDLSLFTEIQLKMDHVFKLAERRRTAGETVRSAFFADTIVGLTIARMYESLMAGAIIQVRAFSRREQAAEWLNVPVSVLLPGELGAALG